MMSDPLNSEPVVVRTLMGARNLDYSVGCLHSLVSKSQEPMQLVVHSDGSLGPTEKDSIRARVASNVIFIDPNEADDFVSPVLARYPMVRAYRARDVMFKKLVDIVVLESGPRVRYCDSDIFFFEGYSGLFASRGEDEALFMRDIRTCYAFGWNPEARRLFPLPERLNAGLIDYPTRAFDFDLIEFVLKGATFTNKLWEEQTLWAVLASRLNAFYPERLVVPGPLSDPNASLAWHLVTPLRPFWPIAELARRSRPDTRHKTQFGSFKRTSYPAYIGARTAGGLARRARAIQMRFSTQQAVG